MPEIDNHEFHMKKTITFAEIHFKNKSLGSYDLFMDVNIHDLSGLFLNTEFNAVLFKILFVDFVLS